MVAADLLEPEPPASHMSQSSRSACAAALLLGLATYSAPTLAFETYDVTGVAAKDALSLREEPEEGTKPADWKAIGTIPANATNVLGTGRTKLIGAQRWIEVAFDSKQGWVNSRFLKGADTHADLKGETFHCHGTEPFWGVTLGPKDGEYNDPESKTTLTTTSVQPSSARLFPLLYRLKDHKGQNIRATVSRQEWCIDGMSDYEYGFEMLLSDDENFQQGCCVIQR
jgi:uncharacterized membrane protein